MSNYPTTFKGRTLLEKFKLGQDIHINRKKVMQLRDIVAWDWQGDFIIALGKPVLDGKGTFQSRWKLTYNFYYKGDLLFSGDDFYPSPLYDFASNQSLSEIVGWLSISPGDIDEEYFDNYTEEQLRFASDELLTDEMLVWEEELRGNSAE